MKNGAKVPQNNALKLTVAPDAKSVRRARSLTHR